MSPQTADWLIHTVVAVLAVTWIFLLACGFTVLVVYLADKYPKPPEAELARRTKRRRGARHWTLIVAVASLAVAVLSLVASTALGFAQLAGR